MIERVVVDRRSGEDRREKLDIAYFERGCINRRDNPERRLDSERRRDWTRITAWSSVLDSQN